MKFTKAIAAAAAGILAVTSMAVSVAAEPMDNGIFIIGFADGDWKASFWGKAGDSDGLTSALETTAVYTGDGTYTVKIDLSGGYTNDEWVDEDTGDLLELTTGNGIAAMGVQIYGEEYENLGVDITSVKVDGTEIALTGTSFTNDEDGGRRTNVYNEWAKYDPEKHDTLDPDTASSTIIDKDSIGEWSVIEITFDAYTIGGEAEDATDEAPAEEEAAEETAVTEAAPEETEAAPVETEAAPVETEAAAEEAPAETEAVAVTISAPVETEAAVTGNVAGAATVSTKGSPNTGIADVAAVAGIAVLAAGAFVLTRKRK